MNILFLCHRIPFPPNKGDKIRSYNELIFLLKKHSIYLATTLDDEADSEYIRILKKYCERVRAVRFNRKLKRITSLISGKPFSISNFYDRSLQAYVDDVLSTTKIDAVICFCSSMAEYIFNNPLYRQNGLQGKKLIMDFVDLDSDKWLQYATYSRFPLSLIYRVENSLLFKYEVKINRLFNHSVFVSEREVKVFRRLYPQAMNVEVIPNGVDYTKFSSKQLTTDNSPPTADRSPLTADKHGPILVFTGFMDYFANEDGVKWFCQKIFPIIKKEFPHVEFYIVGNKPTRIVKDLAKISGVHVTGYVDNIWNYYWMADVCVIPLRIARGLQNKVLEAMATGNAVVATSNASDGIICHHGEDIFIADDEEDFAQHLIGLIRDEKRRKEMGQKAAENIRAHYSWETNLEAFNKLLETDENRG
jgi:polysaccharide biosynthesis protein PslH